MLVRLRINRKLLLVALAIVITSGSISFAVIEHDVEGELIDAKHYKAILESLQVIYPYPKESVIFGIDLAKAEPPINGERVIALRIEDDQYPQEGPDDSGGPFTGFDVDAVGGLNSSYKPVWGNSVNFLHSGSEIIPTPGSNADILNPVIEGLFGGPGHENWPGNVLGPPDAWYIGTGISRLIHFTSIGKGGVIEIAFSSPIIDIPGHDIFVFEHGGANDKALYKIYTPEPTTILLIGLGGLELLRRRRR